ncbi:alpha/beta fold hydrolase [soil metagenome]
MLILKWLVLTGILLVSVAALTVGWHFSSRILAVESPAFRPEFEILEVLEGAVVLPRTERTGRQGLYGLRWENGRALLSDVLAEDEESVRRRYEPLEGTPPRAGDSAQMDSYLYGGEPRSSLGLDFESLVLRGEAGDLHAWWLGGEVGTAVIMLHGRGAGRHESLRTLPAVLAGGYGALLLAYRNHNGSAPSPDGFHHYGKSEWRDVMSAVDYLVETQSIERVVLYGFSMGGAVALEAARELSRRELALGGPDSLLAGIILDAPMLDVNAAIREGAVRLGLPLPGPLARLALLVARLRTGIDWTALDKRRTLREVHAPILLIHGVADAVTPVHVSDEFAALAPQQVRYHRVLGAGHVESWNQDPASYEGWIRDFLGEVATVQRSVAR